MSKKFVEFVVCLLLFSKPIDFPNFFKDIVNPLFTFIFTCIDFPNFLKEIVNPLFTFNFTCIDFPNFYGFRCQAVLSP